MMVALSFIFLRKRFPNMNRPYRIKHAGIVSVMAVGVALFFAYLYLPMGPSPLVAIEWVFVLGWFILGLLLALYAKRKYRDVTEQERESRLLGEDLP